MDAAFALDEANRASFFLYLMSTFGCTYICLWSYLPHPSNCLTLLDGFYQEESNKPSSSSGSLARRLFSEYKKSFFSINVENHDRVPGLAFKNRAPYIEVKELELQRLASLDTQLQFYQEVRIKTAIFMGCKSGEIELGMSNVPQKNMEMELRSWFPEELISHQQPQFKELPQPPPSIDQNRPSSSSSSLRSLSVDSPDSSSLFYTFPSSSCINPETLKEASIEQVVLRPLSTTTTVTTPRHTFFGQTQNNRFPIAESEESAITRAILAVISSPSSASSSVLPQGVSQPNFPCYSPYPREQQNAAASAFKKYSSALASTISRMKANLQQQSMLKRAISYFRSLHLQRTQQGQAQGSRPTSTQLHHMIAERRRREKLNESFQALRSLLPPGSKRDKASVLASTREYLSSLQAQVSELNQRNEQLETLILREKEAAEDVFGASSRRFDIQITNAESTSEERIRAIMLHVTVRGECPMLDVTIRILEFLKQANNIGVVSMEADSQMVELGFLNRLSLRLRIEGNGWNESAFREAVRRVLADLGL